MSVPSSQAAHTQPFLQSLLRSSEHFSSNEVSVSTGQPFQTVDPTGHHHITFMFQQGSKETCWDEFLRTATLYNHCTMAPQPSPFFAPVAAFICLSHGLRHFPVPAATFHPLHCVMGTCFQHNSLKSFGGRYSLAHGGREGGINSNVN